MSSTGRPRNQRLRSTTPRHGLCLAVASVLAAGLLGCANAAPFRGVEVTRDDPGPFVEMTPVSQPDVQGCGYASMSTVALYHGVSPEKLRAPGIVREFRGRTLSAVDLIKMARVLGLVAFGYEGSVDDLAKNLGKGRPVIVLLSTRPRIGKFPSFAWSVDTSSALFGGGAHWVVVVSTTARGGFVLHDPAQGCLEMKGADFLESWRKQSRLCILVSPPPKPEPKPAT